MTRTIKVASFVLAFTLLLGSAAFAALPRANSVYRGEVREDGSNGTIRIESATRRRLDLLKVVDQCGGVYRFRDVRVRADGTFRRTVRNEEFDVVEFEVTGQFVTRRVAEGTVAQVACAGGGNFRAVRQ